MHIPDGTLTWRGLACKLVLTRREIDGTRLLSFCWHLDLEWLLCCSIQKAQLDDIRGHDEEVRVFLANDKARLESECARMKDQLVQALSQVGVGVGVGGFVWVSPRWADEFPEKS